MSEPPTNTLDLDQLNGAGSDLGTSPLVFAAIQIAGLSRISYSIVTDEVVDLIWTNQPAGDTRISMRGPVAELKALIAMADRALDRANREIGLTVPHR
jgi:hypothetical protein